MTLHESSLATTQHHNKPVLPSPSCSIPKLWLRSSGLEITSPISQSFSSTRACLWHRARRQRQCQLLRIHVTQPTGTSHTYALIDSLIPTHYRRSNHRNSTRLKSRPDFTVVNTNSFHVEKTPTAQVCTCYSNECS